MSSTGRQSLEPAYPSALSGHGRSVGFDPLDRLVPEDASGQYDVYVRDLAVRGRLTADSRTGPHAQREGTRST